MEERAEPLRFYPLEAAFLNKYAYSTERQCVVPPLPDGDAVDRELVQDLPTTTEPHFRLKKPLEEPAPPVMHKRSLSKTLPFKGTPIPSGAPFKLRSEMIGTLICARVRPRVDSTTSERGGSLARSGSHVPRATSLGGLNSAGLRLSNSGVQDRCLVHRMSSLIVAFLLTETNMQGPKAGPSCYARRLGLVPEKASRVGHH